MKRNRKSTTRTSPRRRCHPALALAAIAAFPLLSALTNTAHATDDVYTNPNGTLWSTTANWSDGFLPGTGDRAFVSALGITLNVDYANFPLLFLVLDAGNAAGNATTLFQTIAADNMVSQNEWIGDSGTRPTTYLQLAANNTDTGDLSIAHTTNTAVGQYTLQGGNLTVLGSEYVGNAGAGTFTQTGGTHTIGTGSINENLFLGYNILSSGAFTLNGSAAQVYVNGSAYIGGSTTVSRGFGTLTIQSGKMTVTGTLKVWNGTGSVSLTGGTLSLGSLDTSGNPSNFQWNGGTLTLASDLSISSTGPLGNSISIDSSKSLLLQSSEIVGDISAGTLTQTGGANTVFSTLIVGNGINGTGIYTMNNAAATLTVKGVEYVGNSATGTIIGSTITQYGGAFNQATGNHSVSGGLLVGFNPGATGSFALGDGTLAIATTSGQFALNSEYIGYSGTGNFTQTGGTHTIGTPTGNQTLYVGYNAASLGSFTLNNNSASATLTVNGNEVVGYNATGTSSGGNITRYGGSFTQSAGNHTVTGSLFLGANTGSTGSYTLSGGTLATGTANQGLSTEYIGDFGTANFTQTGGTHTVGTPTVIQDLYIGADIPGIGTYTLNNNVGPAALTVYGNEILGYHATGTSTGGNITRYGATFIQTAGSHTVTGFLVVGFYGNSTGSYTLSGGSLVVGTTGGAGNSGEYIANGGTGSFTQSGGSHTIGIPAAHQDLILGDGLGIGTYTMNNAAAILLVNGNVYFGGSDTAAGGVGVLNLMDGSATITGTLTVWNTPGSAVNLSGGTLHFASANNMQSFIQSPGNSLYVTGSFTNSGTASFAGAQFWSPTSTFTNTAGTATFFTDPGTTASRNLSLAVNGGTVILSGPQHLQALSFTAGTLDVNGDVFLASGTYAALAPFLNSHAITTSSPIPYTAVALVSGSAFLSLHPTGQRHGQTVLSTDLLLSLAYLGDATLDDAISIADYAQVDAAFLLHTSAPTWLNGDFNYDGVINYKDYALIDFAFLHQSGGSLADGMIASHTAQFGPSYLDALQSLTASAPEPSSLSLFTLSTAALLLKHRKR